MVHLRKSFESGEAQHRGTFVIGTVQGDLHDIGKNLVSMVFEDGGWKIVDLGVDVASDKFLEAVEANPGGVLGMSALLTTTMVNMEQAVKLLKEKSPDTHDPGRRRAADERVRKENRRRCVFGRPARSARLSGRILRVRGKRRTLAGRASVTERVT